MLNNKRILGVITARGGSKGLPRKNILPLGGKPLIAWSLEAAAKSDLLDRTIVSTDDPEIAEVAKNYGGDVPFLRPEEIADDVSPVEEAVLHAADMLTEEYDYLVLLQNTSPFRIAEDIDHCILACEKYDAQSSVTLYEPGKSPYLCYKIDDKTGSIYPLVQIESIDTRRQALPSAYMLNGAVYVTTIERLRETRKMVGPDTVSYIMPANRSIDIDDKMDLIIAEAILNAS